MGFSEEHYAVIRPFLYHLNDRRNIQRIRRTKQLQSAAVSMASAGQSDLLRHRRGKALPIEIDGERVIICDQAPLYERNARFLSDWSFADLVKHLNQHVFFWSGSEKGPVPHGQRHFQRYQFDNPVVIRAPFRSLPAKNSNAAALFCKYNSGSARWSNGRPSPRGPETFSAASAASFSPGEALEVVFRNCVTLPDGTECASSIAGPWDPFSTEQTTLDVVFETRYIAFKIVRRKC